MPNIRPISELRNNANEISNFCKRTGEPVFITKNGVGDMVVMSMELFEKMEKAGKAEENSQKDSSQSLS